MCFLVHPAHFTESKKKVCEMLNSESTNIQEEVEVLFYVLFHELTIPTFHSITCNIQRP